ncbi:Alpha-1B adrenergic receptor [Orchesella cincta]|uniref:Alpha-1B adrenergic receptor n=1 Tax=Orchesella cincta TaxID=48709 RepID=A0A1D2M3H7_ORCCI|nr:Alpha-1B adrenergic receptor [Orchesella cincta]
MAQAQNLTIFEDILHSAQEWSLLKLTLCIFLALVCLTTIVGNSIVLYVFAKSKRALRSPCHIILANLAIADFLVGLLVMPILISVTVFDWKWYWGETMCQVGDYIHFSLCAVSMLSWLSVCLERYVGVRYPMHHKRILTKKRMRWVCAAVWILGIILTSAPLSLWPLKGSRSPFTCQTNLRHDFIFFVSTSLYWIPISLIFYIYWLIYKTSKIPSAELMQWARKNLNSTLVSNTFSKGTSRRSSKSDEEKFIKARKKQIGVMKNMTKLVFGMLLLYGPLFFLFVMKGLQVPWFSINLLLAFGWLRYFNSCVNVFLYIYVVPYYKQQLMRLLCNAKGSLNAKTEAETSAINSENEPTSFSYSSSCANGTSETSVGANSNPSEGTKEVETSLKIPCLNPGDKRCTIVREMDDIVAQIDKDLNEVLVVQGNKNEY